MKPVRRATLGLAALALVGLTGAEGASPAWDHADREHRYVRITSGGLKPEVQRVGSEMALGWVNDSDRIARVSFAREVGAKLLCRAAGGFRLTGDRLSSPDIQSTQFASLCSLAPGDYAYRVELLSGIGQGSRTPRAFEGRIVVE